MAPVGEQVEAQMELVEWQVEPVEALKLSMPLEEP